MSHSHTEARLWLASRCTISACCKMRGTAITTGTNTRPRQPCCACGQTFSWRQTLDKSHCSACWISQRRSTASTTIYCCGNWSSASAWWVLFYSGCGPFLSTEHSKWHMTDSCQQFIISYLEYRKDLCWGRFSMSCTRQSLVTWSCVTECNCISMPTTAKCTYSVEVSSTTAAVHTFTACISDINAWMSASRLLLNPAKMQVMWLGSSQLVSQIGIIDVPLLSTQVRAVESARELGVVIDSQLSLSAHVTALCQSGYYYLR